MDDMHDPASTPGSHGGSPDESNASESSDSLRRAVDEHDTLRVVTALSTAAVREACARSGLAGAEAIVVGRALTAGYLLATVAKNDDERVRIQLDGGGAVGVIVVDAHGDGRGRAALQAPLGDSHPLQTPKRVGDRVSIATLVGTEGGLTVTRDVGLARPYQGSVALQSGELDEDLEFYLTTSEQLPSALRCEVVLDDDGGIRFAGGVLVQTFPGSSPEAIQTVRQRLAATGLESALSAHGDDPEQSAAIHDALAAVALPGVGTRTMLEHPLRFHCPCGYARARRVLSTLGADDLDALADEQPQTEVRCNFCGRTTTLGSDELRAVAQEIRASQG